MWAEVGAALADDKPLDGCAALRARLASTLVDAEIILKITAAVNPVDAGALAVNALLQDLADATPQALGLGVIQCIGNR